MMEPHRDTRWWGWGGKNADHPVSAAAQEALRERLGATSPTERVALADLDLPDARQLPAAITNAAGAENVYTEREDRVRHALGKSYPDLIAARTGRLTAAPDAVVIPADSATLERLIKACAENGTAVVPYGGGTSVVGGVSALAGEHDRVVSVDTVALRDVEVDHTSMTARLGAGLRGPEAEAALRARGVSLGHYPQSYDYATIGGYAATRSAGQASTGIGRFDKLVASVGMATPAGRISTIETPHTAAGPALREVIVGSEGTLGIIDDIRVRVRPVPEQSRYEAWFIPGWEPGITAFRDLAQAGAAPDVLRLSDPDETEIGLILSGPSGWQRQVLDRYLGIRGVRGGCFVLVGWEGSEERVKARRKLATSRLKKAGAAGLGSAGVGSWERTRFQGPYLRDELMDMGVLVDTLETSHTWSRLPELYAAVRRAIGDSLAAMGTEPIVLCHISHVYPDGASLYFSLMARALPGSELDQWRAAKAAACEAIVGCGGTITHHHAVGTDHAPYLRAEIGDLGIDVLSAVKEQLDPAAIMNPGKLTRRLRNLPAAWSGLRPPPPPWRYRRASGSHRARSSLLRSR